MGKNIIDFIIKFGLQGLPLVMDACKKVASAWKNIVSVIKSATSWVGKFKSVLNNLFMGFGTLASIISLAITAWQMFKKSASEAAEAAREALEKQKERLNNMAAALKNWTNSLKETADLQGRLEKERLITAEYEARTKAVKEATTAPFDKGLIFLFFFGIMLFPQIGCGKLLIFRNHESATLY